MKKIFSLIILVIALNAQTYTEQWREIEKLEKSRLPKSALEKVEQIYLKAKRENNDNQLIKTLIHKNRYLSTLSPNDPKLSIINIEKEIEKTTKIATKLILKSILAEMYSNQNTVYYNEMSTVENSTQETPSDMASQLYIESLGVEAKDVKIEKYRTILTEEENSQGLRPTLYDFLAFRALKYFNNSRNYLHKPIYDFYLKDKEAFSSIQSFINHNFDTPNKESYKYKTLLIYQELLRFHKSRKDTKALQYINFERINFVYSNFIGEKKDIYYIDALNSLESQHMHSEALYYLAKYYYNKNNYRKAIGYAKRGIDSKDKFLSSRCIRIKKDIEWKSIVVGMEKVTLPDENILAKLSYRNIDKVFVKVIKTSEEELQKLNNIEPVRFNEYIIGLDSVNEFNISLPAVDDYKMHHTELSFGSYNLGHYVFLVSKDKNFSKFSSSFSAISKIAYFHKNSKLMVVDRESGEPLEGVEAKLYISKYDKKSRKNKKEFLSTKKSDKDGIISLPQTSHEYKIHLKHGEDSLNFARGSSYNREEYSSGDTKIETLHFFTDRAIYRPNQTIYFKGLAVYIEKKSTPKILVDREIEVTLSGVNGEQIESKSFITNEFGTINGFFTLPKGGVVGSMRISSNIGGVRRVQVEEYKRAKFEVKFDKLDESYRLGDRVKITGVAKAYAGNPLDGVEVKYSIKRETSFPWYGNYRYNQISKHNQKILTRGKVTTDKNGKFKINFDALADESILTDKKPSFTYTLSVDVTDSTGETQSSSKSINLGFVAVNVSMIVDKALNIDSNKTVKLDTKNLDGKFEALKGKMVIDRFKKPDKIYRKRYWSREDIDKPIYNKKRFHELFKNYIYIDKDESEKERVDTIEFDTKKSKFISLNRLKQGRYLLTLYTKDRYGTEVEKSKTVIIYDLEAKKPPYSTALWDKTDKERYEINSTATIYIKSSFPNSFVLLDIEKEKKIVKKKWIKISELQKELVDIKKRDRGDIFYYLTMVKNSRQYRSKGVIKVPWKKKLKVEYSSFRDKLKPNQKEQWSIKISGEDRDKVVAEMVATMYDASLDKFIKHRFDIGNLFQYRDRNYQNIWEARTFSLINKNIDWGYDIYKNGLRRVFPKINGFNNYIDEIFGSNSSYVNLDMVAPAPVMQQITNRVYKSDDDSSILLENISDKYGTYIYDRENRPITVRKNLKETMFFKPNLRTDNDGNIIINFTTNEALTRWKFLAFAHTKELQTVITEREIVTQKELMVVTNLPRFFREGDSITLSAKVVNMSQKDLNGVCKLKLQNPENGWNIYGDHNFSRKIFLKKGASTKVDFKIKIPQINHISTIQHTIIVKTEHYLDAEQIIKPILSNREFITESKALSIKGNEKKTFILNSLRDNNSSTLKNHKLTLEFTSNPIWYAIKSLPYLMEYPHECNEQLFNRYFSNILASKIVNSNPKIKTIFDSWRGKNQLKSALTTNQNLKSILLQETPWVLDAKNEEESQKRLGLLFDLNELSKNENEIISKLAKRQNSDGGWSWFLGGKSNWYISQYLVEGFGKLKNLGVKNSNYELIENTITFMDKRMLEQYRELERAVEEGDAKFEDEHITSILIHYLYSRSFYHLPIEDKAQKAYSYYLKQIENYWAKQGLYEQGMIALTLSRKGKTDRAKDIVKSLKERALVDNESGMYFKYKHGFYWNEMPIETHTLMIDVFNTIGKDKKSVELLKTWLLKNKQTTHWKTTKATASAIHALLLDDSWLSNDELVDISFDTKIEYKPILEEAKVLAQKGSGYIKATFDNFDKNMATVEVKNSNSNIAWGGLYWQYFEDLDKIKSFKETPLKVDKKLFILQGDRYTLIDNQTVLKVGERVKVQIVVSTDRDMEYIMLKDSRASTFEPTNVLSKYMWKNSLGYYMSTKDNATYFFIDFLKKGTYQFEYSLFITHKGNFSNGIATIESMYAPEFRSHSKGEQINVK